MAKPKFDKDQAFRSVIGMREEEKPDTDRAPLPEAARGDGRAVSAQRYEKQQVYITREQKKAILLRAATSDRPEDKDISAIVRAALDLYLKGLDISKMS